MRLFFLVTACFLLCAEGVSAQSADGSFLYDASFHQHVVTKPGDRLRFSERNLRVDDSKRTIFTSASENPRTTMSVTGSGKGRIVASRYFIYVNPATKYRIEYTLDPNAEYRDNLKIGVVFYNDIREMTTSCGDTMSDCRRGYFDFITGPDTKYLKISIHVSDDVPMGVDIGGLALVQLSDAEKYMQKETIARITGIGRRGYLYEEAVLNGGGTYEILTGIACGLPIAADTLVFRWYAADKICDEYYCVIREVKGVEPQWNGIRVEWKRKWEHSSEAISMKLENIYNNSETGLHAVSVFRPKIRQDAQLLIISSGRISAVAELAVQVIR